ncbi:MAG: radical SAM protein [bacterium]
MGFTFIFTNDCGIGVEQLMAILKRNSIQADIILSKYSFVEMAHLRYFEEHGNPERRKKARALLENDAETILEKTAATKPDAIGLSATTSSYRWSLSIAEIAKSRLPDTPIIMGGPHPSAVPERVIAQQSIDAVFIDEADSSIVAVYGSLTGKNDRFDVPGLWIKKRGSIIKNDPAPFVQNLDSLPFKDTGSFIAAGLSLSQTYSAIATRGCPFKCSYCVSGSGHGNDRIRRRSPASLLAELERAVSTFDISSVGFVDDVFIMDREWLYDFLPAYKERIGLPYACLIHPNYENKEIVTLLKDTGCFQIKCGVQSVNPVLSKEIFNRNLNLDKIRKTVRDVKESGIIIKLDFIIGVPTETEQDLRETADFIREVAPDDIFLYFLEYYPGARIIEYALANGYITNAEYESYVEGREMAYQLAPNRFQGEELAKYRRYNKLIRDAAGSGYGVDTYNYLFE